MLFKLDALHLRVGEIVPPIPRRDGLRLAGQFRPFVCHLEKEQERQLFEVVLIAESVVAYILIVTPQLLDDAVAWVGHAASFRRSLIFLLWMSAARAPRMRASSSSAGSSVGS